VSASLSEASTSGAAQADPPPEPFAALLRGWRIRAGLSQEALAERAALSAAAISALEHGRRRHPHPHTTSVLAEALDLDPGECARFQRAALAHAPARPPELRRQPTTGLPASAVEEPPSATLPRQLTTFVGREAELADLGRLLDTSRLVTLVGAGGIGKTRLALEAAAAAADRDRCGVLLVDLAPLIDPALVPDAAMAAVGVRPLPGLSPRAAFADALRDRRLLLMLDNCEHVVEAAAALAEAVLRACPALRVLATSRQPLGVQGEVAWRVPPLSIPHETPPTAEGMLRYPAPRLFAERAAAASPSFVLTDASAAAVAEVCRRLDGIPLAIELAATRVRLLGVDQLRQRLDDRFRLLVGGARLAPERQQTLRATLDWSYALLAPAERHLFAELAVFAGGWSLEAAEHVCGSGELEPAEVLRLLGNLVDQSLVVADLHEQGLVVRYRLLETMREYAAESLAKAGESAAVRDRHLGWYLAQAERVPLQRFDEHHLRWLAAEYDNLRAALRWSIDSGQIEAGLRLAVACAGYWQVRGSQGEGRRWLAELVDRGNDALVSPAGTAALNMASQLAMLEWDVDAAQALVERCLAVAERRGDRSALGYAHLRRGIVVGRARGDRVGSESELGEALRVARELGDRYLEVYCLYSLGMTAHAAGNQQRADNLGQQLLGLAGSLGHAWGTARAHLVLGHAALARRAFKDAGPYLEAGLAQSRELADMNGMGQALIGLGQLAVEQAAPARAHAAFAEGLRLARQHGDKLEVALALEGLAGLVVDAQPELAVRLLAAAHGLRATLRSEALPNERHRLARWRSSARRAMGQSAYVKAELDGSGAPLDSVIAAALHPSAAPARTGSPGGPRPRAPGHRSRRSRPE
jgi:non-specific serine/threonine protein kinase